MTPVAADAGSAEALARVGRRACSPSRPPRSGPRPRPVSKKSFHWASPCVTTLLGCRMITTIFIAAYWCSSADIVEATFPGRVSRIRLPGLNDRTLTVRVVGNP